MTIPFLTACALLLGLAVRVSDPAKTAGRDPLTAKVPARMPDRAETLFPAQTRLHGYLGRRVASNETNRLLAVDEAPLLAGFQERPGSHPWIGEHVGKWLHAATLAWANSGDPELREKMDRVAGALIQTQEADGYLGTYAPDKRFGLYPGADWDVWSHKYNLLGLLTYYEYTGSRPALEASRKIGDLLVSTFGPGKKSILAAGTHVGMAATSVLEPMVLLYRATGDARYLDFARYIVASWDEPGGPRVLSALTKTGKVNQTANGKAYEMLSNLVGLCELARATGDRRYLAAPLRAWQDVTANQLYVTGTTSHGEHFHADHNLPNKSSANIGETCVTVTWIQLNSQLLRLTGDARFGNELERSYYNHLSAAQRPDGRQWCYYTALEGTKPYTPGINCCVSSGPRGMAMAPQLVYLKTRSGSRESLTVNLFEPSRATLRLGGQAVTVEQTTGFPRTGRATLTFRMAKPATFGLQVRCPDWAKPLMLGPGKTTPRNGWVTLEPRVWKNGDTASIHFSLRPRLVAGTYGNVGRTSLAWGPFVLAFDQSRNPALPFTSGIALASENGHGSAVLTPDLTPLTFTGRVHTTPASKAQAAIFVPFADAGTTGGAYRVWLRAPGTRWTSNSLLEGGRESRTRAGNVTGSINDGDPGSYLVTYDGTKRETDWFAVTLDAPTWVSRVVFAHGYTFHDGGWFDASIQKPRIECQRQVGGPWEPLGTFASYPATTATDARGLRAGQTFTLQLAAPQTLVALRVIGTPAYGDDPRQAFTSCAELQAFAK